MRPKYGMNDHLKKAQVTRRNFEAEALGLLIEASRLAYCAAGTRAPASCGAHRWESQKYRPRRTRTCVSFDGAGKEMEKQLESVSTAIIADARRFFQNDDTKNQRYFVAISGRPGSGKTTIASRLSHLINQNYHAQFNLGTQAENRPENSAAPEEDNSPAVSTVISLDGCRSVLDQFEDAAEAHRRRGSPETYDAAGYSAFMERLAAGRDEQVLRAPGFSHARKDPVADAVPVFPHHHIVILEGLYTLLTGPQVVGHHWHAASARIHFPIRIDIPPGTAKDRLIARHIQSGLCPSTLLAAQRVDSNDHPNGEFLLKHSRRPHLVITSIEDPSMATTALDQVP
ncbi:hypothetical protein VP01_323g10 [Puccinia sorghi]|uniref:Phosphoribulokinase/uridine kinase domain-containing protein n=1 Tax=Puccinia sorghi TaxID=27349 RepID=A0A0L6UY29_9BASI|nr:hypothetical protein VP01_323g10 [Puccinia sorghi]